VAILWQQLVCPFGAVKRCKVNVQPSFQICFGPIVETTNPAIFDLSILAATGPFLEQLNLFLRVAFHGDS